MERQIVEFEIQNFTSHKKTIIKPAEASKLTVITGPSSNGKSNIFRAFRKLFYNIPAGEGFIRKGANECILIARYDDGYMVRYRRTRGGISRYTVTYPDGTAQEFDEGREGCVPLEVQEVTGVRPLLIGGIEPININLAEQLDGPFLGTKNTTAPARAKVLGKLAGTEEIDYAGKCLGTDIHRRKQDEKRLEMQVKDLAEKLKDYEHLEELNTKIEALGLIMQRVKMLSERRNRLQELLTQRECLQIKIKTENERLASTKFVEGAELALVKLEQLQVRNNNLKALVGRKHGLQIDIDRARNIIAQTDGIKSTGEMVTLIEHELVRRNNLKQLLLKQREVQSAINVAKEIVQRTSTLSQAEEFLAKVEKAELKLARLTALTKEWNSAWTNSIKAKDILIETAGLEQAEDLLKQAFNASTKKNEITKLLLKRTHLMQQVKTEEVSLEKAAEKITNLQREYIEALKQHKVCPTCGAEVNPEKLKEVI